MKEESEKVGLKLNIQKTKIMASGPITSWQIDGKTMETVRDFIFLDAKITADGDCSHEIKTLAPWMKNYDQPRQHIKKQRYYFTDKGPYTQSYVFFQYSCESWTTKKAECQRIDAFELWCWRRLLRVPWTARRSNQPILREINPECSLEGLMLKLKLQCFGHLMWRTLIGKDPDVQKDWRQEEKGMTEAEMVGWHHWLSGHEFEKAPGVCDRQGSLVCCSPWSHKESDTEWLNWTDL